MERPAFCHAFLRKNWLINAQVMTEKITADTLLLQGVSAQIATNSAIQALVPTPLTFNISSGTIL